MIRSLALLVVLLASATSGAPAAPAYIPVVQPGEAIPAIPLVAQDGRGFSLADFRGNAVAVSFIYTRCRDARMCPLVSAKFSRAQRLVGGQPIHLVVVTLDPDYDRPVILARYGAAFGQNPRIWTLATGSAAATAEFAARFGIATSIPEPGVILHTEGLMIVSPDGRLVRAIYGNDWSVEDLAGAARAALPGRADPLVAVRAWLTSAMETCGGGNIALGGTAMLGVLAFALAAVGSLFWLAFRERPAAGARRRGA